MNCGYVEQLLPLYIGCDLDEERSILVADHLQTCKRCADVANEYAQANQLLQRFEAPAFGDAVYAGIRSHVLIEIERKSHAPAWSTAVSQFFASLVQPRMRWITAALVLAISLTALYFIAERANQLPDVVNVVVNVAEEGRKSSDSAASAPVEAKGDRVTKAGPINRRSRQREKVIDVSDRRMLASKPAVTKGLSSPNNRLLPPDIDLSLPPSASAPLRVEIQTSDRNIRIIWLSSQRPQGDAKETSKGI